MVEQLEEVLTTVIISKFTYFSSQQRLQLKLKLGMSINLSYQIHYYKLSIGRVSLQPLFLVKHSKDEVRLNEVMMTILSE